MFQLVVGFSHRNKAPKLAHLTSWDDGLLWQQLLTELFDAAIAIFLPAKPQTYTNFFASRRAGYRVRCQSFAKGNAPSVSFPGR